MVSALEPGSGSGLGEPDGGSLAWHWRLEDAAGTEVDAPDLEPQDSPSQLSSQFPSQVPSQFPSQSDAESWVGEVWRELLDGGVDAVTLFEGDRKVYGPMSLHST